MAIFNRLGAISGLDLSKVRSNVKRRHGWTEGRAVEAEADYRRFLYLLALDPTRTIVPWTMDLDKFWHEHILDTAQYAKDCTLVFGQFIHHDPNIRLAPEAEARAKHETAQLFQREFIDRNARTDYQGWLIPSAAAVAAVGMMQPATAAPRRDEEEARRQQANSPAGSSSCGSAPGIGGGCGSAPSKAAPSAPAADSSGPSCSSGGGASCGGGGCGGGG